MSSRVMSVCTPLTGTFYSSPSPDEPPYVTVGQAVKDGDVVCIVESMKVFTEIRIEKNGVVRKILVENEDPVNIHQPLIEIELS
jgi:acetyl-CoA carboxylase biotin carboxyl carrier protein